MDWLIDWLIDCLGATSKLNRRDPKRSKGPRLYCWLSFIEVSINSYLKSVIFIGPFKINTDNNHAIDDSVKEPETSFWYNSKTSLKSYYANLHISPTFYWLSTDQNATIGRKSEILRFDQNWPLLSLCMEWQIIFSSYVHG